LQLYFIADVKEKFPKSEKTWIPYEVVLCCSKIIDKFSEKNFS